MFGVATLEDCITLLEVVPERPRTAALDNDYRASHLVMILRPVPQVCHADLYSSVSALASDHQRTSPEIIRQLLDEGDFLSIIGKAISNTIADSAGRE